MPPEQAKPVEQANEGFFAAARELIESVRAPVNETIEIVSEPLMRDGTLAAAFRQGADELWQALKAFPDTIEIHESGSVLNPLHSDIAADRKPEPAMSLTEILKLDTPQPPELDKGKDQGLEL